MDAFATTLLGATGLAAGLIFPKFVPAVSKLAHGVSHKFDDHKIYIGAENDGVKDKDSSHIHLEGPLGTLDKFITCKNTLTDTEVFSINHSGAVFSEGFIHAPNITTMQEQIELNDETALEALEVCTENQTTLDGMVASVSNTPNTLVKRGSGGGINATSLLSQMVYVATSDAALPTNLQLIGDAQLFYIAVDSSGVPRTDCYFRFGREHNQVGDFSSVGDGLEFFNHANHVQLQCEKSTHIVDRRREECG